MRAFAYGLSAVIALGWVGGCNSIIDLQEGHYDGGGGPSCAANEKRCVTGQCRSDSDPAFGCGSTECNACTLKHAIATCGGTDAGSTCTINRNAANLGCELGWGDCNGTIEDGCERSLSQATNCGGCGLKCTAAARFCALVGSTYQCTATCSAPNTACGADGNDCVDTQIDPNHCGGCDKKCGELTTGAQTGKVTCETGHCIVRCEAGYHHCGTACVADSDPNHCGGTCTQCPLNAVCTNNACACPPSFPYTCSGTCSATPCSVDGCKSGLISCGTQCCDPGVGEACCNKQCAKTQVDPLNCGQCGCACGTGITCDKGVCGTGGPAPTGGTSGTGGTFGCAITP